MAPTLSMVLMDARVNSFAANTKPKSKAKPAFPLSPSAYPHLTPSNLASAGFFHDPSSRGSGEDVDDTCKCFLCGLKLGGWDEDDDPHVEHVKRGQCAWAEFVCQPKVNRANGTIPTYTADSLPQSTANATWREATYQKAWPHKQKSGWLPTVKKLAQAGFVYNASSDSKDAVLCPLCDYSVEGWEATDDPWKIHQDKAPDCQFFVAKVEGEEDKAPSKSRKTRTAKGKRSTEAVVESQTSEVDATDDEPQASSSKPPPRTRAPRSRKKKVADETEEDEQQESGAELPLHKSKTADADEAESVEEKNQPIPVVESKKTRGRPPRAKAKATYDEESVAEDAEEAPKKTTRATGKKATKTASEVDEPGASEADDAQVEEEPTPKPASKQPGRPRKTAQSKSSKSKTRSEPEGTEANEMVPSEVEKESTSARSKSSKASKASASKKSTKPSSSNTLAPAPLSSQLDRFVNIPPSSPFPLSPAIKVSAPRRRSEEETTPRTTSAFSPRPIHVTSKPARPSPHSALSRDMLDKSLTQGAMEARRVMEELTLSAALSASVDNGLEKDKIPLTEEQKKMTLEQLVRSEMAKRQEIMRQQGEAMIRQWEERTAQERKKIENL